MNYLTQINTFYELLPLNQINANSQSLYFSLLHMNNKCNWIEDFTVANSTLMVFTGLNISALQRARNELIQKGYITYKKGKGNCAGTYKIIEFANNYIKKNEQQSEQQTDNKVNNKPTTNEQQTDTLYKQNNKQNNKENIKKKKTEFDDILSQEIEDEDLKKAYEDFIKMRKTIKKPLTSNGLELAINKVRKLSDDKTEQLMIIRKSILNSWQGLFPLKEEDKKELKKYKEYIENNMTEAEYYKKGGGKCYV